MSDDAIRLDVDPEETAPVEVQAEPLPTAGEAHQVPTIPPPKPEPVAMQRAGGPASVAVAPETGVPAVAFARAGAVDPPEWVDPGLGPESMRDDGKVWDPINGEWVAPK
jgi:hypothetical protein